jgi:O-antigen/teichoic acid export membrane protein
MIHEEALAKKFVQKGFWIYLFAFLIAPLWYITRMAISRDLTVEEVGMFYGAFSLIGLLSAFNDFWCTESLNYFLPKYIIKNEYGKAKYLLKLTFIIQLLTSISIGSMLFIGSPWLANHYFQEPHIIETLQVATLYFVWINLTHLTTILLSISQNMKISKWIEFIRSFFMTIWVGILYFTESGNMLHYSWVWIISLFITLIFSGIYTYIYYYKPYFQNVEIIKIREERNHFFKYALATLLTANIGTFLSQVDMQMIIFFLGSKETGYYSNYLSIISLPFMILSPIIGFLFPVISELHWRGDIEKIRILQSNFSLYISIFIIWISVFLIQFWESLSELFFWTNFIKSGTLLLYSWAFLIFNLLSQINFQILAGTGNVKQRGKILLIVLPINIILNAILIYKMWIFWSALAVGLSWIPLWYMSHKAIQKYRWTIKTRFIIYNLIFVWICAWLLQLIYKNIHITNAWLTIWIAVCVNLIIFSLGNFKLLIECIGIIRNHARDKS